MNKSSVQTLTAKDQNISHRPKLPPLPPMLYINETWSIRFSVYCIVLENDSALCYKVCIDFFSKKKSHALSVKHTNVAIGVVITPTETHNLNICNKTYLFDSVFPRSRQCSHTWMRSPGLCTCRHSDTVMTHIRWCLKLHTVLIKIGAINTAIWFHS